MPKVRILSGNEKGAVVEMSLPEAQVAYCTGYAELYIEEPPAPKVAKPKAAVPEKPKGDYSKPGGRKKGA